MGGALFAASRKRGKGERAAAILFHFPLDPPFAAGGQPRKAAEIGICKNYNTVQLFSFLNLLGHTQKSTVYTFSCIFQLLYIANPLTNGESGKKFCPLPPSSVILFWNITSGGGRHESRPWCPYFFTIPTFLHLTSNKLCITSFASFTAHVRYNVGLEYGKPHLE